MYIRKYLSTLLFAALAIGYIIGVDLLTGLPWYNFIINWNYSLTDPAERIAAWILVLFLAVPDILHLAGRKRREKGQASGQGMRSPGKSESASSDESSSQAAEDSGPGLPTGAESVNQGGNNQGGGETHIK